jgi:hypothetical protein
MRTALLALGVLLLGSCAAQPAKVEKMKPSASTARVAPVEGDWFLFVVGVMSEKPEANPDVLDFAKQGVFDGYAFWPPLTPEMADFIKNGDYGLIYWLPPATPILEQLIAHEQDRVTASVEYVEGDRKKLQELSKSLGGNLWWNIMPEYDSSGYWHRPRPTATMTREEAYRQWKEYYLGLRPLGQYLRMPSQQMGINLLANSGFSRATHYAYELGAQLNMLERCNDAIGDLTTGIAFARGAGRQYGRPWGIDISKWRDASASPMNFDENGRTTGWSLSYIKRHLYISYMSGANVIFTEPTPFYNKQGQLNPIGELHRDFHRFTQQHPDRGRPQDSTAIMLDLYHGFEPKTGEYGQGDTVWYGQIPYSAGDHMTNNFLRMAFPDHWLSGKTPGAFWAPNENSRQYPQGLREQLAKGMDPRPYEPMGTSRWGDHIDVLLSNAPLTALRKYRTIILVGDVKVEGELKSALSQWVKEGGTLVANAAHFPAPDEALTGVKLTGQSKVASQSRWLEDATAVREGRYQYPVATLAGAEALADDGNGVPLVTRHRVSKGEVILSLPDHLYAADDHHRLLGVGWRLYNSVMEPQLPAQVEGPPLEWLVNRDARKTVVTLVNNHGSEWQGQVLLDKPRQAYQTTEWLVERDRSVPHQEQGGKVSIPLSVPPYDLRIIALEAKAADEH